MAHTLRKINLGNSALAESTITDYVSGGETYTLAELGIVTALQSVFFITQATFDRSFVNQVVPRLLNNKVVLEIAPGIEIPTTAGINFTFVALVHGT
jgi:hypothetical protein